MENRPALWRVVFIDYLAFIAFVFPLVSWGVYGYDMLFQADPWSQFVNIALVVTVVGLCVLVWRCWLILSTFTQGTEVPATINQVGFFRGRGRVHYIYTYQQVKYKSSNVVNKTVFTRNLHQGQSVTVMVNANRPKQAFIKELYLQNSEG